MKLKLFKARKQEDGKTFYFAYLHDGIKYESISGPHVIAMRESYQKEMDALEYTDINTGADMQLFLSNDRYRCKQWIEVDVSETPFETTVINYKEKLLTAAEGAA